MLKNKVYLSVSINFKRRTKINWMFPYASKNAVYLRLALCIQYNIFGLGYYRRNISALCLLTYLKRFRLGSDFNESQ